MSEAIDLPVSSSISQQTSETLSTAVINPNIELSIVPDASTITSYTLASAATKTIKYIKNYSVHQCTLIASNHTYLLEPLSETILYYTNQWSVIDATPYPVTQQGTKLTASNGIGTIRYGNTAISADGNTLITGGYGDSSNVGAAWIFIRSNNTWSQQAKLVGSGSIGATPYQGTSVSISADGNTAITGGIFDNSGVGAAWVFTRSNGIWTQQAKLVGSGNTGASYQGQSVSLSADGNTAAVGGNADGISVGAVWIYTRTGSVWTQQGSKLVGTGNSGLSRQGSSIALSADGNTLASGGYSDDSNAGAVWIFTRSGSTWSQQGSKLIGTGATGAAKQGQSVSLSATGDILAVGGNTDDSNAGATWVFTRIGSIWSQQGAKLVGRNTTGASGQGYSVSLSATGDILAVGGNTDDSNAGAVWLFGRMGISWSQKGVKLVGSGASGAARQGYSVSLSAAGDTLASGGNADNSNTGAVWVFT